MTDQNGIAEYVCREWVDEVFINLPKDMPLPQELMDDFIDMGVTVHLKLIEMGRLRDRYSMWNVWEVIRFLPAALIWRHGDRHLLSGPWIL